MNLALTQFYYVKYKPNHCMTELAVLVEADSFSEAEQLFMNTFKSDQIIRIEKYGCKAIKKSPD